MWTWIVAWALIMLFQLGYTCKRLFLYVVHLTLLQKIGWYLGYQRYAAQAKVLHALTHEEEAALDNKYQP